MTARSCDTAAVGAVPLPREFYFRSADVVAPALLGCIVVSRHRSTPTAGRIVETEAYLGPDDEASHAAFRPGAHALLYGPGGQAYVFQAYGVHLCLNAIAAPPGQPGCVLIRALEPCLGLEMMARRRGVAPASPRLASGPGTLTRALGLTLRDNGIDLSRGALTIVPSAHHSPLAIDRGPRVGITRSVDLPLRFWIAGSPYVSRPLPPRPRRPG